MKKIALSIILLCATMLTGCVQLIDMTEQESDIITEYMAGVTLKHSGYKEVLVYPDTEDTLEVEEINSGLEKTSSVSEVGKTEDKADTNSVNTEQSGESGETVAIESGQNTSAVNSINELFNDNEIDINFDNFSLAKSYLGSHGENYFNLGASSGKQLLIANFTVENKADQPKKFNLVGEKIEYLVKTSDGNIYKPLITLLEEDLQFINIELAANETYNAVIVYQVPHNINTSDLSLSISKGTKNTVVAMK